MCYQFTILAQDASGRVICQCEHGTIHLFWTRASLYIHPAELPALLTLLRRFQPEHVQIDQESFSIIRLGEGWYQLCCDCVGLMLSEADLYSLIGLVGSVCEQLGLRDGPQSGRAQRIRHEYRTVTAVPQPGQSCRN